MKIKCRDVKRKCTPPGSVSDLNPRIRVTNFRIHPMYSRTRTTWFAKVLRLPPSHGDGVPLPSG